MLLGPELTELVDQGRVLFTDIRSQDSHSALLIADNLQRRAAFAIPQVCIELAYHCQSGAFMSTLLRQTSMRYSLVCLATGIGDDLVDMPETLSFRQRIEAASSSVLLGHSAYSHLAERFCFPETPLIMSAIGNMSSRLTSAALAEARYRESMRFSFDEYLRLAEQKTTSYTVPAFWLGNMLARNDSSDHSRIEAIGHRIGTVIQVIDDLLDGDSEDPKSTDCAVRAGVAQDNRHRHQAYQIINDLLTETARMVTKLRHPVLLLRFVTALQRNLSFVSQKIIQ